jgi:NADPH:quinone reductase-like Zn-dependent oxidoreductase
LRFVWRMGLMMPIFLMMRSRSVLGINMLRLGDHKPEVVSACLAQVVQAHAQGILKPHVHREYSAGELPQAHVDLSGGRTMGKLVVRVVSEPPLAMERSSCGLPLYPPRRRVPQR